MMLGKSAANSQAKVMNYSNNASPFFVATAVGIVLLLSSGYPQDIPKTNTVQFDRIRIALLPPEKANPVSFAGARIDGKLDAEDRKKLETLIGRIPYLVDKVESIDTSWPDHVVAAKIIRSGRMIFCTKSEDGEWQVVKIILFARDKF